MPMLCSADAHYSIHSIFQIKNNKFIIHIFSGSENNFPAIITIAARRAANKVIFK